MEKMDIWFHPARDIESIAKKAAERAGIENFPSETRPAAQCFGDFQINGALAAAKAQKTNPRVLAEKIVSEIRKDLDENYVQVSIAGPGFINFALKPAFLRKWLEKFKDSDQLKSASSLFFGGKKTVIDFPSPNTAKQMHVGHLRPMVIGEAIQRILRFCGADMVCDNHIGDWGTNFGILILGIKREKYSLDPNDESALEDLERMYKAGSALVKANEKDAEAARAELVKLQSGDPENLSLWKSIVEVSKAAFDKMYERMGVHIDVTLGESFYRDKVGRIYKELEETGLAEEDNGALVVFHREHPRFNKQPFIIRKSDGASNYASTDLATLLYRSENFGADEVIYVTDGRQQDHFQQLFLTAKKWFDAKGYKLPSLKHVWFGTILGEDGKAIKTKSGEPVKLKALLDEAVARAKKTILEKNPDTPPEEADKIAETVGVSSIKYADLVQNRTSDYVFSWDKLLSFDGNTAPYLLYAVARIHSIFRKLGENPDSDFSGASDFETPEEISLARKLVGLPAVFEQTVSELRPHYLCIYLFELAGAFSTFYNNNKVIVDEPGVSARRRLLCSRTLRILETGLRLLGIEPLEKM